MKWIDKSKLLYDWGWRDISGDRWVYFSYPGKDTRLICFGENLYEAPKTLTMNELVFDDVRLIPLPKKFLPNKYSFISQSLLNP